jgi:CheY-like chemotaxis protein
MRLLIVDDDASNMDMISRRLKRRGYEILKAVTGVDGIKLARTSAPDLILMDLSLPMIDGWEAIHILKTDPTTKAIPIIALTAHAMSTDRAKALAAGSDDFDNKPVDMERLLDKIRALTSGSMR